MWKNFLKHSTKPGTSFFPQNPESKVQKSRSTIYINTVKPVCNDHLYNKIYYLWLIL